jgi:hypothetical protein
MRVPAPFRRSAFDLAIQQLRDGRPGESGYGRRIALLLTLPAFDDPVARDVRRSITGELYVVRTVWNRTLDLATSNIQRDVRIGAGGRGLTMMAGLELSTLRAPSLTSTQPRVDQQALDRILESVATATVPCRPSQPEPPLDATVFELTFGEELSETRYRWYGDGPPEWTPLATFASGLIRLVEHPAASLTR